MPLQARVQGAHPNRVPPPLQFLASIGTGEIPHGSRIDHEGKPIGTFLDHLTGTEAQLRAWGCEDALCHAGMYHSIYGTEGFQGFTLSTADRPVVREVIGERAEAIAYLNCVMDRESLDQMVIEHHRGGGTLREAPRLPLRARPNPTAGLDGSETFALTAEEFSGLITVQLADHLEGFEHQMNKPGVSYISHAVDGEPGWWRIPQHGWFGYRQQSYGTMALLLGGVMLRSWEEALGTVPPGSVPAAWQGWRPDPEQGPAKL